MTKVILIILPLLVLFGGVYLLLNKPSSVPVQKKENTQTSTALTFENPKKSAHYESNTPEHEMTLAGVPINVVINFNFDLASPSDIKIEKDGKGYGVSEIVIDDNKLSMRRNMSPNSPDGIYKVIYNACWPDGSCHDGNFQFAIDRGMTSFYNDLTGQKEVTINMSNIQFNPMNIRINKATKITWVNDDELDHYVNTDSHPAHTYYPNQNSKALKKGETYSLTFDTAGFYPYHCSAHANTMKGSILVE